MPPIFLSLRFSLLAALLFALLGAAEMSAMTLAELRDRVAENSRVISDFRIEGSVCALSEARCFVTLQDQSTTVLLELPSLPDGIGIGSRLAIEGRSCAITRQAFSIRLGIAPLVDLDGRHSRLTAAGLTDLKEGMQPLRVEWYNAFTIAELGLEYEGPGIPRQPVPSSAFHHRTGETFERGLRYDCYVGHAMKLLPNFRTLQPVRSGVSPTLDVSLRAQPTDSALVFTGYIQIPTTGRYTFHLTSDDGGKVTIGENPLTATVLPGKGGIMPPADASLRDQSATSWVVAEGDVTFANRNTDTVEIDIAGEDSTFHAIIADDSGIDLSALRNRRIRVTGVARGGGVVAVNAGQIEILGGSQELAGVLNRIAQVRRLQPAEARKPYRVKVQGVITTSRQENVVVQDATGGVYIPYETTVFTDRPRIGERWEFEGKTDPGRFSPIILPERATLLGNAPLPEAVRPTWEQLVSGSLDAEFVEIEGLIVRIEEQEMVMLTRDGRVRIFDRYAYPLPYHWMDDAERASLPGSVVRIRGVFVASWDPATGRVNPAEFELASAKLMVDQPPEADPFSADLMPVSDLLLFTSHASAFKRVKVAGVVQSVRAPEVFLTDGSQGFRVVSDDAAPLKPGERVEAVGFARLGGPSPMLLEAKIRSIGKESLPAPAPITVEELPNPRRDATRVKIEATLLSDTLRQDERTLEMQAGEHRFVARLDSARRDSKPIDRGSVLELTGVYASAPTDLLTAAAGPFEILLGDPSDIRVVKAGPWWTLRHTITVVAILSGSLLMAVIWVVLLRRTVGQRTRQLAIEIEERQQLEQHRVMEKERARVAQDLHDELGSGLTEVSFLTSLAKNPEISAEKKESYLNQLETVSATLVSGLDEIVWAVNPRYDSVADLASYHCLFAQNFLELAGIVCRMRIEKSIPELGMDSHRRHGIFLAFKEALTNIVRHSHANEVILAIHTDQDLHITLTDDGCGFDPGSIAHGSNGLLGMKERIEKLGGTCRIESPKGTGTTVEFIIPLEGRAA